MYAALLADRAHPNYHAEDFFQVYSDYVLEKMADLPGIELLREPLYSDELLRKQDISRKIELAFSNWGMPELSTDDVKRYFPSIRAVFYAGGSVDPFCHPFYECGARIFAAGDANAQPAAEYTLANILLANKGLHTAFRSYRDPESYQKARVQTTGRTGNYQAKVGLIGVGRVGSRVAELLKRFDLHVYGYDPYLSPQRARELGIVIASLEEIFTRCDVVSSHLPENPQTKGIFGYNLFSLMPPDAVFINAAQSGSVDEDGLVRALCEVPERVAILDSTSPMPLPNGHRLLKMPNVFISPHIAGSFGGELERMGEMMIKACAEYLAGQESPHEMLPKDYHAG